jgi:hypothetical protein
MLDSDSKVESLDELGEGAPPILISSTDLPITGLEVTSRRTMGLTWPIADGLVVFE